MAEKSRLLVSAEEEADIARKVMIWLNKYPGIPETITLIKYEYIGKDAPAMAFSVVQGASITKRYILGGHEAEFQFKVVYRIKPGTSDDQRLKADELLNELAAWAERTLPVLGDRIHVLRVRRTTNASLFARYEDGEEDHQIFITLNYEVI